VALQPPTRLGPYEIVSAIGAGGMGEVYRARDTRLDRTVAIKVLPEHLSNPQLRERFDREAKAISSLSHPHICSLYDVGHQDGIDFLVMEYLEGETLAHRLKKGPLAPDQALQYATQIADAMDTAHRHGVIHRDLKPGNIMLTKAGAKLLDFGLAKMRATEPAAGMTALPTQTTPLTGEGAILGTLQYMAPEQLEGAEADARTDIFAFGAVIYEMATGRKAFVGKSQASVISAIMTIDPPPISTLQGMTPPALDHVVRTCLAKDPEARWQTAHDVLVELKWIKEVGSQSAISKPVVARRKRRELLFSVLLSSVSIAFLILALVHFREKPAEAPSVRFLVPTPDKVTLEYLDWPVVSPDGRRLVFTGVNAEGQTLLWMHSLDSLATESLAGTDGARLPFWSPDSRFVAFFSAGKLKKIDASGGPPQTICDLGSDSIFGGGGAPGARRGLLSSAHLRCRCAEFPRTVANLSRYWN
jgi:serine/threonine protein kinase